MLKKFNRLKFYYKAYLEKLITEIIHFKIIYLSVNCMNVMFLET